MPSLEDNGDESSDNCENTEDKEEEGEILLRNRSIHGGFTACSV